MNQPLLTFHRFNDIALATEFAERLMQLGIYCEIDNQTVPFDVTYANNPIEVDIRIKLRPEDFNRANAALDEYYKTQLDTVEQDYYLFSFTDEELEDIVRRPDEWNRLDYQLALKLLNERGIEIKPEVIESYQQRRIAVLSQTENMSIWWVYMGYAAAVLGGLIGVVVGLLLVYGKKTLPNGTRVYINSDIRRFHGKLILAISAVSIVSWYIISPLSRFSF